MSGENIQQIIPCEGWLAIFLMEEEPWWSSSRLSCWALVEEVPTRTGQVEQSIIGVEGFDYQDLASNTGGLYGYIHERDITDTSKEGFVEAGKRYKERNDERRRKRDLHG